MTKLAEDLFKKQKRCQGAVCPFSMAIYMLRYDHYFQTTSSPLKLLGLSKPNFMWSLLGKRGHKFLKIVLVKGCRAHVWPKPLKIFFGTRSPMIMKLSMDHWGLKVYEVYIDGLTLTYFNCALLTAYLLFAIPLLLPFKKLVLVLMLNKAWRNSQSKAE